jgi:hypothetical protein
MSDVLVPFLYELRRNKIKVGPSELIALGAAMKRELHGSSLDGFYHVARALLIHREQDLDAFDQAFLAHFKGIEQTTLQVVKDLSEWLDDPIRMQDLSDADRDALKALGLDEVRQMLEERMREQTERHDGGNKWVGTGGTSPFGNSGVHPTGVRVGGKGGGRSAMGVADARMFAPYRTDVVLDVRQIEVALRKLRSFLREGVADELDIEGTIDATARNFGELDVKLRPPRRTDVKVLLLMDVGGSMDPYAHAVSQLFSAAKRASNLREVRSYYFHNAIYGRVFPTETFSEPVRLVDLMHEIDARWRLVIVGDASMHPGELMGNEAWDYRLSERGNRSMSGWDWFSKLREHFPRSVWLNPDPPRFWEHGTSAQLKSLYPMFHLTLDGLGDAVKDLSRKR